MRLVTYCHGSGSPRAGALVEAGGQTSVVDLAASSDDALPSRLEEILDLRSGLALARVVADAATGGVPLEDVRLMAPIRRPGKIVAVAGNYPQHLAEGGMSPVDRERSVPRLFLKPSTTILGPGETLVLPAISGQIDWEVELAVVIGQTVHDVSVATALEAVAGYCVMNDVSARKVEWGLADRDIGDWDVFFDWMAGKWLDGFAPLGPWLSTTDDIPDPQDLTLELKVNGDVRQHASTREMIFSVAEIIAHVSRVMTLKPGDIIATGTPAGVGVAASSFLGAGDIMEAAIQGLGTLETPVTAGR